MDFTPENTLASASYDIFTCDAPIDPKIKEAIGTLDIEESAFTLQTINFMKMQDRFLNEAKLKYYVAVSEATNLTSVQESASDMFSTIKQIFDKFIKFIKSLFTKFINSFNRLIGSDSYLKKNLDKLRSFSSDNEFHITGYNFTFSPSIPNPSVVVDWSSNFFNDAFDSANVFKLSSAQSVRNATDYDALDARMDQWRGSILNDPEEGTGAKVYSSDFAEECFAIYRDHCLETEDITVDMGYLSDVTRRYKNYSDTKKTVEREAKEINKSYEAARKQLEGIGKDIRRRIGTGSNLDFDYKTDHAFQGTTLNTRVMRDGITGTSVGAAEANTLIDRYINYKVNEITSITNAHALAFSSKLDALTACYKQDRNTLYMALNKVAYINA